MSFLYNTWHMAGWSWEVDTNLFSRRFLNQPVVMFRDNSGEVKALADRCPHRFVPLSQGRVVNNTIECPYHGLCFDGEGHCTSNPQGNIPPKAVVRAYPTQERDNIIWIWMGDEKPDSSKIPNFSFNNADKHYFAGSYLKMACHYQLAVDNIMDLSHIDFIHRNSIGAVATPPKNGQESKVVEENGDIWSERYYLDTEFLVESLRPKHNPQARFNRWIHVRWNPPACMLLVGGHAALDADIDLYNTRHNSDSQHTHIFTPETETSSHYWFGATRSKLKSTQAQVNEELKMLIGPFSDEDEPMLRHQQMALGTSSFWQEDPIFLQGDAAALRVRRTMDKLMEKENAKTRSNSG